MPGYPYNSWIALISLIIVLLCMPFIPGQATGLISGVVMVIFYSLIYLAVGYRIRRKAVHTANQKRPLKALHNKLATELSEELSGNVKRKEEE